MPRTYLAAAFTLLLACTTGMPEPAPDSCEAETCDEAASRFDAGSLVEQLAGPMPELDPVETEAVLTLVNLERCGSDQQCIRDQCGESLTCLAAGGHEGAITSVTGPLRARAVISEVRAEHGGFRNIDELWTAISVGALADAETELRLMVKYAIEQEVVH